MNIYFSGIGGVGIGPLAEIASDAGFDVFGSDVQTSSITKELQKRQISLSNDQSGEYLKEIHAKNPIDWFVYTSALPNNHPELLEARALGIRTSKRDELLAHIIDEKNLKLIAVAGTHGKTSTTGMLVWTLQQLGIPTCYSIGTTIGFGPSGRFDPASEYFVYECDEYDKNFLHFRPYLSLITSLDYDHPDTYPNRQDYIDAFSQFLNQSSRTIMWRRDTIKGLETPDDSWVLEDSETLNSPLIRGKYNRSNATLVLKACELLDINNSDQTLKALESFPGTDRRFERLADNLYSDYGHHPAELAATLQLASEYNNHVVLVYQPHQNTRQHQVRSDYTTCAQIAEAIYWLPTYLSREDPSLPILTPEQLIENLSNRELVSISKMDDELWSHIQESRDQGKLVLCMGAGDIDAWLRQQLAKR